jgi:hypothetical protein
VPIIKFLSRQQSVKIFSSRFRNQRDKSRVARWYIFKPKIQICEILECLAM